MNINKNRFKTSRRAFIRKTLTASAAVSVFNFHGISGSMDPIYNQSPGKIPWFRTVTRWGQTNITEKDPARYDITWWRSYWKRTNTQGVIVNAGGIVAYYPSQVPLHQQAEYLGGRDLFGELCNAAHSDGLAVFARMDSNRANENFYHKHPEWFATDRNSKPYKAGNMYVTCINGPYYEEHIPEILKEIAVRYNPEGFTDNSWSGLGRDSICYCGNCRKKFRIKTGMELPAQKDWNDPSFRAWIKWSYERRIEIWELNNKVTKEAGGADCIWSGMNSGSVSGQCKSFRDYREICRRAEIIMLDSQSRSDESGFQQNGNTGKLIHSLLGWDKLIPESMAMYQAGRPTFRLTAKPAPEARMWMLEGIAGGIQPWWHHVGAYHEDRRMYHTARPIFEWHKINEAHLINRKPIAGIGVVWSQQNTDFYGRDEAETLVDLPFRGFTQALIRARIPYLPVHADDLERDANQFSVLVLPNLGAMTAEQCNAIRKFAEAGGSVIATGETSLFNEWGDLLPDFALGDLFGVHIPATGNLIKSVSVGLKYGNTFHTYLRLKPEFRQSVDGPHAADEPAVSGQRHEVLQGFDETDILPYGGTLDSLKVDPDSEIPLTYIPEFPIYPPETAWMRQPKTDIPGLVLRTLKSGSRIVFMPADIDRQFARYNLPDHGNLLANIIRYASGDKIPIKITGPGLIDCHLYQQGQQVVMHLVNLTSSGTWRQPVDELIPVGPLVVRVKLPHEVEGKTIKLLVDGKNIYPVTKNGWCNFEIRTIVDHEVGVIS
jgi:hypothetical protein